MGVLKNVSGKWRFFWVLEAISLSVWLAVFAINVTGNASSVQTEYVSIWKCDLVQEDGCDLYSWDFILHVQPVALTCSALLVAGAVSLRAQPRSPRRAQSGGSSPYVALFASFGFYLAFFMLFSVLTALEFGGWKVVSFYGKFEYGELFFHLFFAAFAILAILAAICVDGQYLKKYLNHAKAGFSTGQNGRWPKFLWRTGVMGLTVVVYGTFFRIGVFSGLSDSRMGDIIHDLSMPFLDLVLDAWLVSGLYSAVRAFPRWRDFRPHSRSHTSVLLVGWGLSFLVMPDWIEAGISAYESHHEQPATKFREIMVPVGQLVHLVWSLVVGTFLRGEKVGEVDTSCGVAFWAAASRIRSVSSACLRTWFGVWFSGGVK